MAAVATVYNHQPRDRISQAVFENLFGLGPPPLSTAEAAVRRRERSEDKQRWARGLKAQTSLMDEVVQELQRRDPVRQKHWVLTVCQCS